MLERHSAIETALAAGGRDGADGPGGRRQLRIGELAGWTLWQATAYPGTEKAMTLAIEASLGELPVRVGPAIERAGRRFLRTTPSQILVLGHAGDGLGSALLGAVAPEVGALVDLSQARSRFYLEGEPAPEVLRRGAALDFHDEAFPAGHFAQSGIHHTPVLIHRAGERVWELFALRTFALDLWDWLTDACRPFGYEVE